MLKRPPRPVGGRVFPAVALGAAVLSLSGCDFAVLDPRGPIGSDEKWLILFSTALMLTVVVPVTLMALAFAWRYRASNKAAAYTPDWEHSNAIEAVVWFIPCLIIATLGYFTWTSSHELDPYRPIASQTRPVEVQVVSMDWKWLFIYPEQKIATVNELVLPVGTPVHFSLTSQSMMNTFFVPRLGSMIYTMPGMQTQLSLLADQPGDFPGVSANYSGEGFSDMSFAARAVGSGEFDQWVATVRSSPGRLSLAAYRALEKPTIKAPVAHFGVIDPEVYRHALLKCADGAACMDGMMSHTAAAERLGLGDADVCGSISPKGL